MVTLAHTHMAQRILRAPRGSLLTASVIVALMAGVVIVALIVVVTAAEIAVVTVGVTGFGWCSLETVKAIVTGWTVNAVSETLESMSARDGIPVTMIVSVMPGRGTEHESLTVQLLIDNRMVTTLVSLVANLREILG